MTFDLFTVVWAQASQDAWQCSIFSQTKISLTYEGELNSDGSSFRVLRCVCFWRKGSKTRLRKFYSGTNLAWGVLFAWYTGISDSRLQGNYNEHMENYKVHIQLFRLILSNPLCLTGFSMSSTHLLQRASQLQPCSVNRGYWFPVHKRVTVHERGKNLILSNWQLTSEWLCYLDTVLTK